MRVARVELYDTTLRDGTQGEGVSFSVEDKLKIAARLDRLGVDYIEGGWPGSNPKDVEFFVRARSLELERAQITAFGSTRRVGAKVSEDASLRAILDSGVKTAAIFGKAWDFHVTNALRTTLDENLRMIEESVAYLTEKGLDVIFDAEHFFDGYKANPEYAVAALEAAERGGAKMLVLCDTNGGSLPHQVGEITAEMAKRMKAPIGIHTHNDSGVGVANALMAVRAGAVHVQGTINGYGERCGNADLCQIIPNLQLKMGYEVITEEQLRTLTEVSRFVSELANLSPDPRQPFLGKSVFAHKGGIHVSALNRYPETYEHIRPEQVGNQRRVLVSELSGVSNILYKAQEYGIELKRDTPALRRVLDRVKEMEHQGYYFEGAEASFELQLRRALGNFEPYFELIGLRVLISKDGPDFEGRSEATIKVRVGDRILHTASDGNGPVNAIDQALRKALEEVYPQMSSIQLVDYKVRVINEAAGTGAKVRVLIESSGNGRTWGTVGVSVNIVEASWQALADSVEYGLFKAGVRPLEASQVEAVVK